ncbi:MAG: bifunctional precorrin-2 dehydrogenase/sirohydrochlorin ferrochelatase [Desulfobacteraceae bacterium]|jgi:precorrin-2 dehydrogenase/sirohydrochlorin ferrochelatase
MRYYPVYLDIKGRSCLVVGGGQVGTRKVRTLLKCGARVRVISPEVTPTLAELAEQGSIELTRRNYHSSDLDKVFLVIGATDDQAFNRKIHRDAEAAQRLCNIADQPALCNFVLPSIVNQGDLSIAISTAGKSPAFAKHLRRQLEGQFGPEYGRMLDLMGAVRKRLLAEEHTPEAHKPLFEQLIQNGLLEMIKAKNHQRIDALLKEVLGPDYRYDQLMKQR